MSLRDLHSGFSTQRWLARSRRLYAELDRRNGKLVWHGDPGRHLFDRPEGTVPISTAADFTALVHDRDIALVARDWFRIAYGRASELICRLIPPGGEPVWVHVEAQPFDADGAKDVSGIAVANIDEMVTFIQAREEARHSQLIENMAAGIAHELNNALTPLRGFLQLAIAELGEKHPQTEDLQLALAGAQKCAAIVSRLQQTGQKALLDRQRVSGGAFLGALTTVARGLAAANPRVLLDIVIPAELPDLYIDSVLTRQALSRLLRDAMETLPQEGKLTLRASLWMDYGGGAETATHVRLDICNHGMLIPVEERDRAFDPFYRYRGSPSEDGLSLSTAQGLARQMGGWMEIHSTPGQGTEIRCFLPIWNKAGDAQAGLHRRAMVIDKEPYRRRRLARALHDAGWRVDEAESLAEALEAEKLLAKLHLMVIQPPSTPTEEKTLNMLHRATPHTGKIFLGRNAIPGGENCVVLEAPYGITALVALAHGLARDAVFITA